jgi:uncharacterized protein (DUF433 family)
LEDTVKDFTYIGKGIYTVPDVARYTGIDPRKIRRWTVGYKKGENIYKSIYHNDYNSIRNKTSLSFLDLIEIRFIDAFHKHGVSWKTIRIASEKAKEIIGKEHPFSTRKFFTDKRDILTRIALSENENELLNLVRSQYEIDEILQPCLIEGIDFSDFDIALRWYPLGRDKPIIIDPKYNFGRPIIDRFFIDTKLLSDMYKNNKNLEEISKWYGVDPIYITEAINFENKLAA